MNQTEGQQARSVRELATRNAMTVRTLKDAVLRLKLALDRGEMSAGYACALLDTSEYRFTIDDLNYLFVMFGERGTGL